MEDGTYYYVHPDRIPEDQTKYKGTLEHIRKNYPKGSVVKLGKSLHPNEYSCISFPLYGFEWHLEPRFVLTVYSKTLPYLEREQPQELVKPKIRLIRR